jgi:hypothetical protein
VGEDDFPNRTTLIIDTTNSTIATRIPPMCISTNENNRFDADISPILSGPAG